MSEQEKYVDRIAKLLAKAESTNSAEEADALIMKAQELMTRHMIDEAMIAAAREDGVSDEKIVETTIEFTGVYKAAHASIAHTIAGANGCRSFYSEIGGTRYVTIAGFESDVRLVELLNASLQLQAAARMLTWWKEQKHEAINLLGTPMEKFKAKREFIFGFDRGLAAKLHEAAESMTKQAEEAVGPSVALVVQSRKDEVDAYMDSEYELRRTSSRRSYGGRGAENAGFSAGKSADTSTGRNNLGGSRGQLNA